METAHNDLHYVHWEFLHPLKRPPAENSMDWNTCKVVEDWDIVNVKVTRNIILHISDAICIKISELRTANEMQELL